MNDEDIENALEEFYGYGCENDDISDGSEDVVFDTVKIAQLPDNMREVVLSVMRSYATCQSKMERDIFARTLTAHGVITTNKALERNIKISTVIVSEESNSIK
jgi:hypothetical protein